MFNVLGFPFGFPFDCDIRALSEAQMEAYNAANAHLMVNSKVYIDHIIGLANYRRPVTVPEGWSYWYSIADEGMI